MSDGQAATQEALTSLFLNTAQTIKTFSLRNQIEIKSKLTF
jgi:hypothetical protein